MKKTGLAHKLAKKTFESAEFQKSWAVHMGAFGPILEPAFTENYQARIHLTAALNLISSRQLAKALIKLKQLQQYCVTDADKAACLFFLGVYFEISGDRDHMAEFYSAANEYGHSLPMPYLKTGKYYLELHDYRLALDNYLEAVKCYEGSGLSPDDKRILGAAYTNIATCLTMMHRYPEAADALNTSRSLYPDAPGRAAVEATVYALTGNTQGLKDCLQTLKEQIPEAYDAVKESSDRILSGTDPLFFPVPFEEEGINAFWTWFASYSDDFLHLLKQKRYEQAMKPIGEKLLETFPFLEEMPYVSLGENERGYVLELKDCYAVSIQAAYTALIDLCPQSILENWQFFLVH